MRLVGKVALISGGAQGIGRAIAERFLNEGAKVAILDIHEEAGLKVISELEAMGDVLYVHGDVSDEFSVRQAINDTVDQFGFLDIVINNAAISKTTSLLNLSLDDWQRVIDVNLTGPFIMSKYASPFLRENYGCILNIASTRALMSEPDTEAYSASKGGLLALTHALATSLGPNIRVNCVSPGWIDVSDWKLEARDSDITEQDHSQHPAGRVGIPQDIAAIAVFLCSADAGFITGANYVVDGGMTRKMIYEE